MAHDVGNRLRDLSVVRQAVASAQHGADPRLLRWRAEGLWQGYAGLAVMSGMLDAARPGCGWDEAGLEQLRLAVAGAERQPRPATGLGAGLAGLATAASVLSRDGARYRRLLRTLDAALIDAVRARTAALLVSRPHGVGVATFDVIAGLAGAGRYLLTRGHEPAARPALDSVLRTLVYLSEEDDAGVPHWYTPAEHMTENFLRTAYPHGHLNLGLAHGIAGPLALFSQATIAGFEVAGQEEAIARTADWLVRSAVDDEWGVNFPAVAELRAPAEVAAPGGEARPSRSAWCYGAPGIARALWMAGTATNRHEYTDLAVQAMAAVYRRPRLARRIDSPTVCHGVAGLLQVTLRFANESGLTMFGDAARDLTAQLLDAFEPSSVFGYRNLEPAGGRVDHPGLLDGAAGVALVLLAAVTPEDPVWDRVLLLS